jgi:ABC-type transport system involved in cytochrome c biogenesis permease subunit
MKRIGWLTVTLGLGLTLLTRPIFAAAVDTPPPVKVLGVGPAYEALGKLAVMHAGRAKPLDTLAREEVRQIFGRETIKLHNAKNEVIETWGPTAALFDWTVRPSFWDDQAIILVQYLPLKRLILEEAIQARFKAVIEKSTTSAKDRDSLKKLAENRTLTGKDLDHFVKASSLPKEDKDAITLLAAELSEDHKWLTPRELDEARVRVGDGSPMTFMMWWNTVRMKKRDTDVNPTGKDGLTDLEENVYEAGTRLVHYQSIRDRSAQSVIPLYVLPRPSNAAYLAYTGALIPKAETGRLTQLEADTARALQTYWEDVPDENKAMPGTNEKTDAALSAWYKNRSVWIPLTTIVDSKSEELATAGFDGEKAAAFQRTFEELTKAEDASPGMVAPEKAEAFVTAARALGASVNASSYPTVTDVNRETFFNRTNPFWNAPIAYGLATVLLAMSLGFQGFERRSLADKLGRVLYYGGIAGLLGGIGLETMGFTLRVAISGWAPVTNMYETVIWVSFVAAVLGLVFELIYRKTFCALAAAGLAFPGTLLAANVPLLDPGIHALQPVLRSNYWLTIHVLTEVSSYAAFLLAASLGMIATMYYLTATYRRSPSFAELSLPLVLGVPLLAVGVFGIGASYGRFGPSWDVGGAAYYLSLGFAGVGGTLAFAGLLGFVGEAVSRLTFRDDDPKAEIAGEDVAPTSYVQTSSGKPSVAEMRAMAEANRPKLDARGRSMQETAAKIKPISNFIYRTMQVGVLLIAAGTFLGGWWADKSWGRFWGWDPKEVWALITLLVYLIPLHGRFAGWFNTFNLVAASVVCSMSVVMAWYGVNFVLGVGLHAYGFTKGGGQGIVSSVCLALIAFPVAAGWRRYLGSRLPAHSIAQTGSIRNVNRNDLVASAH